jgi:hypothetical protein
LPLKEIEGEAFMLALRELLELEAELAKAETQEIKEPRKYTH